MIRITAQNVFFNLRNIDDRNKCKNYVIVAQVKLSLELDALVILWTVNIHTIINITILEYYSYYSYNYHRPILDKWI